MSSVTQLMGVGVPGEQASRLALFPQFDKAEILTFIVDVSAVVNGTATGITDGAGYLTATKNGVGDFTFTLDITASAAVRLLGAGVYGEAFARLNNAPTTSAIRFVIEDDAGTNSDIDFEFTILVPR